MKLKPLTFTHLSKRIIYSKDKLLDFDKDVALSRDLCCNTLIGKKQHT